MTTNISNNNSTSNSSHDKTMAGLLTSGCIPWLAVIILECLATVILNIITIIVFVKQRQLQRRSTYLIIHLTIVDLLVGAVSGPLNVYYEMLHCIFVDNIPYLSWPSYLILSVRLFFPLASLINLAVISLERLHASLLPFRHRLLKKWVYGVMIAAIWIATISREYIQARLYFYPGNFDFNTALALYYLHHFASLFAICVSCGYIFIKVRCSRHPRHHGAASLRERKLTTTLLIIALVSLLSWLPFSIIYIILNTVRSGPWNSFYHFELTALILYLANSLANPIIYSLRMPEFKACVVRMFRWAPRHDNAADLPRNNR